MQHESHCHLPASHSVGAHNSDAHVVGAHSGHATGSSFKLATYATLHCLLGCAIGELAGLAIGVSLGLDPWVTILLATALGFLSGYVLGLWPLVRTGKTWAEAFRLIWLGETISIGVMELVMNVVDYNLGGMNATSVIAAQFWIGYVFALPAGFVAAWPVNYWLLSRQIKQPCH